MSDEHALAKAAAWFCLFFLVVASGCSDDSLTGPPSSSGMTLKAFNFADWTRAGFGTPAARTALDEQVGAGANAVVLVYTLYQETATSSEIVVDRLRSPSLSSFSSAISQAQSRGLEVIAKIHVDVDDGSWRGEIRPADVEAWFRSYQQHLTSLLQTFESLGVDQFVVGTELASLSSLDREWRETIAFVRSNFSGVICYAASWDEYERVPFWNALDSIGINFYFPVADRANPTRFEILTAWQPWLDRLDEFRRRVGLPIVLTEIGYMSRDGAGRDPSNFQLESVVDLDEQADLYWGALQAVSSASWIDGICWWNWTLRDSGGVGDGNYTPRAKPAYDVLRQTWGAP